MVDFQAIIPKHYTDANQLAGKLDELLRKIGSEAQRNLQEYPAAQPWKNPPPKTGPRRGGRRTGSLGKGWSNVQVSSKQSVTLQNRVKYSAYVQGPKGQQTANMARRGWKSVSDAGEEAVKAALKAVDLS